jgi:hypothetical protein
MANAKDPFILAFGATVLVMFHIHDGPAGPQPDQFVYYSIVDLERVSDSPSVVPANWKQGDLS